MTTKTEVKTKRAIGYFRVSTAQQAGARHVSLATQQERFSDHCQANGFVPVRTFTDTASGRKDTRKEYQNMLQFLQNGEADVIVVQYLDRFGRNPKEILQRIWALQEMNVKVEATDEDIHEEMILLIRAGMAGAESKKTSDRVRANMARAVSNGTHVGRPPYGFKGERRIDSDGKARVKRFIQNPVEVGAIREMYRLVVEDNLGLKSISDRLNANGHSPACRKGIPFESSTIKNILTNEALKGTLVYGKKPKNREEPGEIIRIEGFFPPILTEEEWSAIQGRLSLRSNMNPKGRTFTSSYLLSSLARCGYCGGPMIGKMCKNKKYSYRRYYCSRAIKSRAKCGYYNGHSADALEKAVLDAIEQYADRDLTLEYLSQAAEVGSDYREEELSQVEASIATCEQDFQTHLNLLKTGQISDAQFAVVNDPIKGNYDGLLQRRKELVEFIEKESIREDWHQELATTLTTFTEDFKALPVAQQKARLIEIIDQITVYRGRDIELRFREVPIGA